jgi:tRNA-(ms[2]io[6]A)-hydroxylase
MLHLATATPPVWLRRALANLDEVLVDHAHCEKKAASTAINLMFRYQDRPQLMAPLSALAREELEHFELVLSLLRARGWAYGSLPPSAYAKTLFKAIRPTEPLRLLDTLLCCSLIEARSCERMKLLAEQLDDAELAAFYRSLLASEARHHSLYVDLALGEGFAKDEVFARLRELAVAEGEALASCPREARVHSNGPAL